MKINSIKIFFVAALCFLTSTVTSAQDFQGKAYYFSKTPMNLGAWGARLSEQQNEFSAILALFPCGQCDKVNSRINEKNKTGEGLR